MKKFLISVVFTLSSSIVCAVHAQDAEVAIFGNTKAKLLIQEGNVLWTQQKLELALQKFAAAADADPKASGPWSNSASLYFFVSSRTEPRYVDDYRSRARVFANKALQLNPSDPMAQEILRELITPTAPKREEFNAEALGFFNEGEQLFQRGEYKAAIVKYDQAFAKEPKFSRAVLYSGDSHFQLGAYDEAEARYRQALDIDPRNFQAWRFLAHAQIKQGRPPQMVKLSLLKAIEIQPNYQPAWDWFAQMSEAEGAPLKVLNVKRLASVKQGQKGDEKSYKVELDSTVDQSNKDGDGAAWLYYGLAKANALSGNNGSAISEKPSNVKSLTPWQAEKMAWTTVFSDKQFAPTLTSPLLQQLRQAVQEGEIEAAIFLCFFEEAYRADFEAWKKTNPLGLQKFIEKYGVRPSLSTK